MTPAATTLCRPPPGVPVLAVVAQAPPETVVLYSTAAGQTASDGAAGSRNSPFTAALLKHIASPGDITQVVKLVMGDVKATTPERQTPFVYSNLSLDFTLNPAAIGRAVSSTPSKTPSFGAVSAATGNLSIQLATSGTVSVAGLTAAVPAGTVPVNDLPAGSQIVSVRYIDGKSESRTVTIPSGGTATVSFTYSPPAPAAAPAAVQTTGSGTTGAKAGGRAPGRTYHNEVWVEGGSFRMGSDVGDSDEKPVHTVSVSGFWMMATEVTQGDYSALMGKNPSNFKGDSLPVENVSWYDAVAYANALSKKDGLTPAYTINGPSVGWNQGASGWRLPTEAEWEYAALGGPKSQGLAVNAVYAGSPDVGSVGWYSGNAGSTTHQVATKVANAVGLYDMAGNVWEWTNNWYYGRYGSSSQTDPTGAASGTGRVDRGGSGFFDASFLRSARRDFHSPGSRNGTLGFRLVRPPVR